MAKIELNNLSSGYNLQTINVNFGKIETEFKDKVVYRDEVSPMERDFDMNGFNIINTNNVFANGVIVAGGIKVGGVDIETVAAYENATIALFEYTATAGQTTFSVEPFTPVVQNLLIEVNGQVVPPSDIGIVNSNITIPATSLGASVVIRVITRDLGSFGDVANVKAQFFNGDGIASSFTLSEIAAYTYAVEAYINGVHQRPSQDFTVVGNVIEFTSAPPVGTNNIFVRWISPASTLVPADRSVTFEKIQTVNTNKLLGRSSTGTGSVEEISLGTGLSLAAGTLNASIPSGIPSGAVMAFAMSTAPSGWLKANGTVLLRADYPDLFAAIGTVYNTGGELLTQFRLPDLRGEFVRGYDDGRGIDSGRVFGSLQLDEFKSHNHSLSHLSSTAATSATGVTSIPAANASQNTSFTGGSETRPRNVAMLYCIKI